MKTGIWRSCQRGKMATVLIGGALIWISRHETIRDGGLNNVGTGQRLISAP
jgi:hypothetical protein